MPSYDVKCTECYELYEITRKMSEDNPPCKHCGAKVETYLGSPPLITLVGQGWTRNKTMRKSGGE